MAAQIEEKTEKATVLLRLELSPSLYRTFEQRAESLSIDVEELIRRHLASTQTQDNEKGRSIKLSPEQRQQIERDFSRSFKDGNELAHYLSSVYSVSIGDLKLQLSPDLLKRLDGRRGRMALKDFLAETIIAQLEHFVGMR